MIKVIVGYKVKEGADIQPILVNLRTNAMTFPGFISAENLYSEIDNSIVAISMSWEKLEYWKEWESSNVRQRILQDANTLLVEEPRITIYRLIPTTGWERYVRRES